MGALDDIEDSYQSIEKELRNLGYTNVRVLYIANNFGADWVDKGYPTTKG